MSYQQAVTVYRTPRRFHRRSLGGPSDSGGLHRQWPPRWCGLEGARTRRPPVCWSGTGTCWLPVVCFWSPSILCKVSYIYMCIQYLNKSSKQLLVLHEYTNPHRMKVIYSVKLFIKKIKIRCINNTWNNFLLELIFCRRRDIKYLELFHPKRPQTIGKNGRGICHLWTQTAEDVLMVWMLSWPNQGSLEGSNNHSHYANLSSYLVYFRYILTTRVFFRTRTIHINSIILILNHRLYENFTLFEILHRTTLCLYMTGRHL